MVFVEMEINVKQDNRLALYVYSLKTTTTFPYCIVDIIPKDAGPCYLYIINMLQLFIHPPRRTLVYNNINYEMNIH